MDSSLFQFFMLVLGCVVVYALIHRSSKAQENERYDQSDWTPRASEYAAGRAPSPVQLRAEGRADKSTHQFAVGDPSDPRNERPAPLPHELLRV
jgi:hypothetical protein